MSINQLYISHQNYQWNADTVLISDKNIKTLLESEKQYNCHTSPEDITFGNIGVLLDAAKEIHLIDLTTDALEQYPNSFLLYGRMFNELTKYSDKIKTVDWDIVSVVDFNKTLSRPNSKQVLWTAGCSITAGTGVQPNQRYGHLLAQYLKLPEVSLAKDGSSISFSADMILRSDIQSNDIVVWGITCPGRTELANGFSWKTCTIEKYIRENKQKQYWNMDYFSSSTLILKQIQQIFQVINFCKKINAKLYIANILDLSWIPLVFKNYKNFIDLTNNKGVNAHSPKFVDVGTDGSHPGPEQHLKYAEKISILIKENHHG
jgi:hypothetical protein